MLFGWPLSWAWVVGCSCLLYVSVVLLWRSLSWLYRYQRLCRCVRNVPGWPTHWLWGNLRQIGPDEKSMLRLLRFATDNRYRMTKAWAGPFNVTINIHHPDLVREVLKHPKHPQVYDLLRPWLGDGLLLSGGAKWQRHRKLLTPSFHLEVLRPYVSVYNKCLRVFLDKWTLAAERRGPVKVFDTVSLLSLDIVLQCAFRFDSNCQHVGKKHPYIKAVYDLIDTYSERFFSLLLYFFSWLYRFTAQGKKWNAACKFAHMHSERIINERKKALENDAESGCNRSGKYMDFLDTLLTAVDANGKGLTDKEIRDEVDTFMFEGHDTTTSGIAWTLYCLAKHPEHQEKIREEVREVLTEPGPNGGRREWLQYEDLQHLKYTQMCIKEAMRLYPPVFLLFRQASKDVVLDGTTIPKDTALLIHIQGIHYHPDMWKDPFVYDPLRFDPSSDATRNGCSYRDPLAYMPFSAGSRNCIGQNFAQNEVKVVVASIINRFVLSLDEGHKVEMCPKVVMRTTNDIKLTIDLAK